MRISCQTSCLPHFISPRHLAPDRRTHQRPNAAGGQRSLGPCPAFDFGTRKAATLHLAFSSGLGCVRRCPCAPGADPARPLRAGSLLAQPPTSRQGGGRGLGGSSRLADGSASGPRRPELSRGCRPPPWPERVYARAHNCPVGRAP